VVLHSVTVALGRTRGGFDGRTRCDQMWGCCGAPGPWTASSSTAAVKPPLTQHAALPRALVAAHHDLRQAGGEGLGLHDLAARRVGALPAHAGSAGPLAHPDTGGAHHNHLHHPPEAGPARAGRRCCGWRRWPRSAAGTGPRTRCPARACIITVDVRYGVGCGRAGWPMRARRGKCNSSG